MAYGQFEIMGKFTLLTAALFIGIIPLMAQDGASIYSRYCSNCHGKNLEGGSAPKLLGENLRHGNSVTALTRTIKDGIKGTDMIAWQKALDKSQVSALVNFIKSSQKEKSSQAKDLPGILVTKEYDLKVEKLVVNNLEDPWGIEFVNSKQALITEKKTGNIRWLNNGKLDPLPVTGLPRVFIQSGTSGLMDIALDPYYPANGWVYIAFSHTVGKFEEKTSPGMTKIVRGRIKGHRWIDEQTLFEAPDSLNVQNGDRWGCRFLFDTAGFLYFSIGDMGRAMDAQDSTKPSGKVFRIHPDGSIPSDNPFVKSPNALAAIYTMGNRNVQGIAQDPVAGKIWASEHGPKGGDELNILEKGANYGWPLISYGVNYDGSKVSDKDHLEGMMQPVTQWTPSIAVCPISFCTSPLFPKWKNNMLVGALAFEELRRLILVNDKVMVEEKLFKGFGRVRDIKFCPDGSLYVILNKPGYILRITPIGRKRNPGPKPIAHLIK